MSPQQGRYHDHSCFWLGSSVVSVFISSDTELQAASAPALRAGGNQGPQNQDSLDPGTGAPQMTWSRSGRIFQVRFQVKREYFEDFQENANGKDGFHNQDPPKGKS